jgi:hypothetical protein
MKRWVILSGTFMALSLSIAPANATKPEREVIDVKWWTAQARSSR